MVSKFILIVALFASTAAFAQPDATSRPVTGKGKAATAAATTVTGITKDQATKNPLQVLQTFTLNDLQAALEDATANNDRVAAQCYKALIPIVQTGVGNPLPKGLGGFQALQKARDLKAIVANIQSPNGPLADLNIACAPLVLDIQNTLIQLGIVGGGVAATSGLMLPLALPFPLPIP